MASVKVSCPSCSNEGYIEVPEGQLRSSLSGILAVNVDTICSHSFIVYIDKDLNVRDSLLVDFRVELPKVPIPEKIKADKIPKKDIVDIDLIKLNIPATLLTYVLKSIFLKQKIVLISDQEFLHNQIYNFIKYITQNTFEIDIIILTEETYNNNKKSYKYSMVFENINILRNFKNLINPKKLSVEKQIVNRFLTEYDLSYSYIVLKNDIQWTFILSKAIVDIINDYKEKNETVNTLKIRAQLEKYYEIKINTIYLQFLMKIVEDYFGVAVPSMTNSFLEA